MLWSYASTCLRLLASLRRAIFLLTPVSSLVSLMWQDFAQDLREKTDLASALQGTPSKRFRLASPHPDHLCFPLVRIPPLICALTSRWRWTVPIIFRCRLCPAVISAFSFSPLYLSISIAVTKLELFFLFHSSAPCSKDSTPPARRPSQSVAAANISKPCATLPQNTSRRTRKEIPFILSKLLACMLRFCCALHLPPV